MINFIRWLFRFPGSADEAIANGMVWGLISAIVLIAVVFISGQTFGQRCSVAYEKGTADWNSCVQRLSQGGSVNG